MEPVKVKYVPAVKGGRGWNGFHGERGQVVHAVPEQIHGGFWGGYSLCNTRPGDRSYGWSDTKKEINCPKCLKKITASHTGSP